MWIKNAVGKATTKIESAGLNWYDIAGLVLSTGMLVAQVVGIHVGYKAAQKRNVQLSNELAELNKNAGINPPQTPPAE